MSGGLAAPAICGRRRLRVAVTLLALTAMAILASPATAAPPEPFGHDCTTQTVEEGPDVLFCSTDTLADRVPSFDDTPLDVDVTLPADYDTSDGPLPTIAMLHGYGGSKEDFETDSPQGDDPRSATLYHYNNVYFAQQGYAVVNYTARGFGRSCGSQDSAATPECQSTRSYVHLADQRWEARDTQYLLGLLADQGITSPDEIGVTGISYGGGQSIALAYLRDRIRTMDGGFAPWTSPGEDLPMEISAAFPRWPWSDLVDSLLPNGRFLDFRVAGEFESRRPLGIMKESYVSGLYATGLAAGTYCGEPPRTPPVCDDMTADLTTYFTRVQAGEPYAVPGGGYPADARTIANEIYDFHQGYGTQQTAEGPAPLLIQNGWTDDLFPPKEAIRVYNALREENPDAQVSMQFGDLGHARGSNKINSDRAFNDAGAAYLDEHVRGQPSAAAPDPGEVTAYTQTCPQDAPADGPFTSATYDQLGAGALRFTRETPGTVTFAPDNPFESIAIDPIAGGGNACREVPADDDPGGVTVRGPVSRGFTLLGLPSVSAQVETTGLFGQLDSRLWDVAPDGQKTLVSRGAYRLAANQSGRVVFQQHGNGYCFANGHRPELELVGQDAPFLRPSNSGYSIAVSDVRVSLPTAEGNPRPPLRLSVTPRRTRTGERTRFVFQVRSRETGCLESSEDSLRRSVPVAGATVRLGGGETETNQNGRATLTREFGRAGTRTARATKAGYSPDSATVRVTGTSGGGSGGGEDGGGSGSGGGFGPDSVSGSGGGSGFDDSGGSSSGDASTRSGVGDAAGTTAPAAGSSLPFTGLGLCALLIAGASLAGAGAVLRRRA